MQRESHERRLTPEAAALVQEFLRLNCRRLRGDPALSHLEHQRWMDLRWRIEEFLTGPCTRREGPPRKTLRVPSNYKAEVANPGLEEISRVREIGEGGLFLVTERPMPIGTPLHMELTDEAGRTLELEGTVVWVRRPGEGPGQPGMGVRFEGLDGSQREAVACLVEAALSAL